ncbi:L,D-transpeptidase [Streptomyces sp. NPDC016309]|uniref:L,D-transpeptidase n=1 Tax=Streptomyces sp. NPDC016309 TaxID=3364965 RepID=UPI0036FFC126
MSDELGDALRALSEGRRPAPPVPGAAIRRLAVRRRRRRHAAVTSGLVAAVVAVVVPLTLGGDPAPETGGRPERPATAAPTPPEVARVDLSRRVLSAAGRDLPVTSGKAGHRTPVGSFTVSAKHASKRVSGTEVGMSGAYTTVLPYVIELRSAGGAVTRIAAIPHHEQAPGTLDVTPGWIGLRPADAAWLYGNLDPGDVVTVTGAAPAS